MSLDYKDVSGYETVLVTNARRFSAEPEKPDEKWYIVLCRVADKLDKLCCLSEKRFAEKVLKFVDDFRVGLSEK